MNHKSSKPIVSEGEVLIFPARTPEVSGKRMHFVFSALQIEDILKETTIHSVPLCPIFSEGIAEWRGRVLPVISLEACLGLVTPTLPESQRLIVVRTPKKMDAQSVESKGILIMSSAVRKIKLPIPCMPFEYNEMFSDNTLLKGVFEGEEALLIVVDMEKILSGENEIAIPNELGSIRHREAMVAS